MSASSLALLALVFFVGFVSGTVVAVLAARRSGGGKSAAELKRELDSYRGEVASHYAETARKIDGLTQSYKDLYDHLEQGAHLLVGETELRKRLAGTNANPVTLEGIGVARGALEGQRPSEQPSEDQRVGGRGGTGDGSDAGPREVHLTEVNDARLDEIHEAPASTSEQDVDADASETGEVPQNP